MLFLCFMKFKDSFDGGIQRTDAWIDERQNSSLRTAPEKKEVHTGLYRKGKQQQGQLMYHKRGGLRFPGLPVDWLV